MTYKLTTKVNEMFKTPSEIQNMIFKYGLIYTLSMILIFKIMNKKGYDNTKIAFIFISIYIISNYLISDSLKLMILKKITIYI